MGLQVGERAPDVALPSHENKHVSLAELWSDGPLVLLFFPLAFTSTCTEELCAVRDDIGSYAGLHGRVAAVTVDRSSQRRTDMGIVPLLENAVPTVAGPDGAVSALSRKTLDCFAPPHSRCVRRSLITS